MKYTILIILLFSVAKVNARDRLFTSLSFSPVYGLGSKDSNSAFLGPGFDFNLGYKKQKYSYELAYKQFKIKNDEVGHDGYDSSFENSVILFGSGFRYSNDTYFKAGLASHNIRMEVFKGSRRLVSDEYTGQYLSVYGGGGLVYKRSDSYQFFIETNMFPVFEIEIYFFDFKIGYTFLF
jgi:hypothetical protein